MDEIEHELHYLSPNQLRALHFLAKNKKGMISSTASGKDIGKIGKALGGVFSSLVRRKFQGKTIVIPWGKALDGKGLRWKLNEECISRERLLQITKELII